MISFPNNDFCYFSAIVYYSYPIQNNISSARKYSNSHLQASQTETEICDFNGMFSMHSEFLAEIAWIWHEWNAAPVRGAETDALWLDESICLTVVPVAVQPVETTPVTLSESDSLYNSMNPEATDGVWKYWGWGWLLEPEDTANETWKKCQCTMHLHTLYCKLACPTGFACVHVCVSTRVEMWCYFAMLEWLM